MKQIATFIIGIGLGGIAGYLIGTKLESEKREQELDEHLEAITEHYEKQLDKANSELKKMENRWYSSRVHDVQIAEASEAEDMDESEPTLEGSTVIDEDLFGENDEYETLTLRYFTKDQVLVDEYDFSTILNPKFLLGMDIDDAKLNTTEDDMVYIRNDSTGCYYEIIRDQGYSTDYDDDEEDYYTDEE